MPIVLANIKFIRGLLARPTMMLWLLAGLATASGLFAAWGLMHVTSLSARGETRDDRATSIAITLKEELSGYSKLTYDFLLQQDYSRMMVKEKESNAARTAIDQNLADLATIDNSSTAKPAIDSIRTSTAQFLSLTDKALETAAEEGSAQKARAFLQDQVEPAYKAAESAVNQLLSSRDTFDATRFQHMRSQAMMVMAALLGLTCLGVALLLSLRKHILSGASLPPGHTINTGLASNSIQAPPSMANNVEARSLATLAFANRLNRVRKESDDLKKLLQGLNGFISTTAASQTQAAPVKADDGDVDMLARQSDKIAHAVGRIQHIHDQSRQFVEKLNEMMGSVQKLATDGNVVALNVTIELAKLQHQSAGIQEDRNKQVSEQIRGLATSAAAITGKLAMILSQFRYTQEDFTRHTADLMDVRSLGAETLGRVRASLQSNGQSAARLTERRDELGHYLPTLEAKMVELENQISQMQSIYNSDIETVTEGVTQRSFKVISGGAS